jgi:hypothetical protein
MTLKETLNHLKSLGNPAVRAQNAKGGPWGAGAGDNQFGVSLGDIRTLAKKIKTDHDLALSLWDTGNVDAQFLATLLIQPKKLSAKEMDRMVRSISFVRVADWLISYVVAQHPDKESPKTPKSSTKSSTPTKAPATSANGASPSTPTSKSPCATSSSTKKSTAPSTSPPARPTNPPATATNPRSTGTWSLSNAPTTAAAISTSTTN